MVAQAARCCCWWCNPVASGETCEEAAPRRAISKVAEVTLAFGIIEIAATTLGETGGDALSTALHLGYAFSTVVLLVPFLVLAALQIRAQRYHAALYWAVIVGTTLAGTTMADFADRSLGIGYPGGSALLALCVAVSLVAWRFAVGAVGVDHVSNRKAEIFIGLPFCFPTRSLRHRATDDFLTKDRAEHGLALSRFAASAVLAVFVVLCIWFTSRSEAARLHARTETTGA